MPLSLGTGKGECRQCGRERQDLFRGYCADCRREYGRQMAGQPHVSRYFPARPPSGAVHPNYLQRGIRYEKILLRLLRELADCGFGEQAIEDRWRANGHLHPDGPDAPVLRAIRSVQLVEQDET